MALYGGLGIIPHALHNDWLEEGREAIRRKANSKSTGKILYFDNEPLFERVSIVDTANNTAASLNTANNTIINNDSPTKTTAEKKRMYQIINEIMNEEDEENNTD